MLRRRTTMQTSPEGYIREKSSDGMAEAKAAGVCARTRAKPMGGRAGQRKPGGDPSWRPLSMFVRDKPIEHASGSREARNHVAENVVIGGRAELAALARGASTLESRQGPGRHRAHWWFRGLAEMVAPAPSTAAVSQAHTVHCALLPLERE
ncbi:hypothetical protein Micbo1qcDRAFT_217591 [Microdochium bolleyi]|uniref:Uncharacterized protein n=1 Tax=Microdochium bolleyi TaxID=196109 RepID=A0A136JFE6_9PEZI|nr:hypothetical protein Micbo1qcDRAFT_217591 [Microdochium bolleyi]